LREPRRFDFIPIDASFRNVSIDLRPVAKRAAALEAESQASWIGPIAAC